MPLEHALDFYRVEELFTQEERMTRDLVRSWVSEKVLPVITEHARAGSFPRELVPEMGQLGLFGASFPDYGCPGLSQVAHGLIMQELERGDSGLRSFASVQSSLVMFPIRAFGSEAQKDLWLPLLRTGEAIGCFGLTEADHGSDPSGMETKARPDGDGWILNGSKMWITNGGLADIALVWARTDKGIQGFLVERDAPGFSAPEIRHKFSLRASVTSELVLQDCRVPASAILPEARGLKSALACLNQARYGISWGALGAAQACLETALAYALSRTQFGRPIASFQLVQQKLTEMVGELAKAQLLAWQLGKLKEVGRARPEQIALAKRNNVAMALSCARAARDILGAAGITDEYPVARHLCNLESVSTYEGTHDIHALIVGAAITGLEAFR